MRSRILLLLVSVLAIALIAVAATQAIIALREGPPVTPDLSERLDEGYIPPVFRDVAELGDAVSLRGTAEPDSIVVLSDRGERIRQLPVDADGRWEGELSITAARELSLSAEAFIGETSVRGDETVIRIPAPGAEDGIAQRALIILTAPGGPTRVIQTPFGGPMRAGELALVAVEYDDAGGTIFSGRSDRPGVVELSESGRAPGVGPVGPDGRWFLIATAAGGPGTLSTYRLGLRGHPESTLEVSFTRLPVGVDRVRDPRIWQVRRQLEGGGSQVTAVFATPPAETEAPAEGTD